MGQLFSADSSTESKTLASSFSEYFKNFKQESKVLSEEARVLIQYFLEKGDIPKAVSIVSSALKDIENAPLSIAVTGESGTGKSTLINALRDMGNEEEGSAQTGPTETTMERTAYKQPKVSQCVSMGPAWPGDHQLPSRNLPAEREVR